MNGLFGEEFSIETNRPSTKDLIKKIKSSETAKVEVDANKVLKSKKITLQERLAVIKENVLRILGKQRNNVLVIKDRATLHNYISDCINTGRIDIDTETNNSLDPITCKLMGPCFYAPGLKQAYVPLNHVNPDTKERLSWQLTEQDIHDELQRINDTKTQIIMHNGKFDYEVIKCTCDIEMVPDWDTIIAARLLDENDEAGLKHQYITKIDPTQSKYDIENLFEHIPYAYVDPDIFALYAATDSMMTDKLYEYQYNILTQPEYERLYWVFKNIEMPIVLVTADMELRGVAVDTDFGARLKQKYDTKLAKLDESIEVMLSNLQPIVSYWRLTKSANAKSRVFQPKKSKKSILEIEAAFPLIDAESGKRYKLGKPLVDQLPEKINLASPNQLAILFYDILKCPAVSKKKPRGSGEEELKALTEKLKSKKDILNTALKIYSDEQTDMLVTGATLESDEPDEKTTENTEKTDIQLFEEAIAEDEVTDNTELAIKCSTEIKTNFTVNSADDYIKLLSDSLDVAANLCSVILERRGIVKLITTYIDVIPTLAQHWPDGRIRFHLNSLGTDTGRYSSGGKIKFIENDEPVTVSGINIQNIPSHNKEIRMLFKAATKNHTVEVTDDNCYIVPETDEVETTDGWKYCKDLVIGDQLLTDEGRDIIKNIILSDKKYLLYV